MNPSAPIDEIADKATRAEINALLPALVARAPGEAVRTLAGWAVGVVAFGISISQLVAGYRAKVREKLALRGSYDLGDGRLNRVGRRSREEIFLVLVLKSLSRRKVLNLRATRVWPH